MQLGSCILEKSLGVGGMGAVYLARQERPRRPVAVKVLRPQLAADPEAWRVFLARFRLEADATAALDHANIVPIYEFGEVDDMAYLVMPYLADGSLAALLARDWMLPIPRAVRYAEHAAAALDYAHEHGIVHRDVKPSNLLLHPDGRLLLADFGIARLMDQTDGGAAGEVELPPLEIGGEHALTQTGSAMGTPEYMAPEQVRGEAAGAAADIYALGIVTYVMLAGRSPFAGGDTNTVLARQLADPPLPLRTIRGEITPRMEEVIFWALAKDPKDRPATAGEFARELAAAAGRTRTTLGTAIRRSTTAVLSAFPAASADGDVEATALVRNRPSSGTIPLPGSPAGAGSPQPALGAAGAPSIPGSDATLYDAPAPWQPERLESAPMWPVRTGRAGHLSEPHWRIGLPLGALAAAVVALVLVATLVFGSLAQGIMSGPNGAGSGAHAQTSATATPTVTPHPTATSTPIPANWLTVSTARVSLACRGKGSTKYVTLRNVGPDTLAWQASVIVSDAHIGDPLTVTPSEGQLESGDRISVALTATSFFSHSGEVTFTPMDPNAGQPAVVQFSISGGCA